jgi:hypothetical protein
MCLVGRIPAPGATRLTSSRTSTTVAEGASLATQGSNDENAIRLPCEIGPSFWLRRIRPDTHATRGHACHRMPRLNAFLNNTGCALHGSRPMPTLSASPVDRRSPAAAHLRSAVPRTLRRIPCVFLVAAGIALSLSGCTGSSPTATGPFSSPPTTLSSSTQTRPTTVQRSTTTSLVHATAVSPYDIPQELEEAARKKDGNSLTSPEYFAATSSDASAKVSFYLFTMNGQPYVGFPSVGTYTVYSYTIQTFIDTENVATHVVFSTGKAEYFADFELGGEFTSRNGEDSAQYSLRVSKKVFLRDPKYTVEDILSQVSRVTIFDPHTKVKVAFDSRESVALQATLQALGPARRIQEQMATAAAPTPKQSVPSTRTAAMGGLVIDGMTEQELRRTIVPFPQWEKIHPGDYAVPQDIQERFRKTQPNEQVLFVGAANEPDRFNAVITSMTIHEDYEERDWPANGFGTVTYDGGVLPAYEIVELVGTVPVTDARSSEEFLVVGRVYPRGNITALRVNLDPADGNCTSVDKGSYSLEVQKGYRGIDYRLFELFRKGWSLDRFVRKGDIVQLFIKLGQDERVVKDVNGYPFINTIRGFTINDAEYRGFDATLE